MYRKMVILAFVSAVLAVVWGISLGEYEDDDTSHFWQRQPEVAPVNNALYQEECGSCHFAYQPGLLPEQSWIKIMSGLSDHFGDNAELGADTRRAIEEYLVSNCPDKADYRHSRRIMRSLTATPAPLRITDIPYIRHQHGEIPQRMISGNPKVATLSHCDACHQTIQSGSFSESHIRIPGFGRWDD